MLMEHLLRHFGNQTAVDNARLASKELSRRRVEHEEVELFLDEHLRSRRVEDDLGRVVAGR